MPNLGNLENMALFVLQQPGANFAAGVPNWASLTNPQYNQQVLDFYFNEGYKQLLRDTNDFAPFLVTQTFPSVANQYQYAIPNPTGTVATSVAASIAAGTQTVTPGAMTNIVQGCSLIVDSANAALTETVVVTATTATTYTAPFINAHAAGALVANPIMPTVARIQRVYYAPQGQNYNFEFRPGQELIGWNQFQHLYTAQGYLQKYAFGTRPNAATVSPDRKFLQLYPGSASSGDQITIQYTPMLTAGATTCAPLVNATDTPLFPEDYHEAILQWALSILWLRARDQGQAADARQQYQQMVASYRTAYLQTNAGETFGFQPFSPSLGGYGIDGF